MCPSLRTLLGAATTFVLLATSPAVAQRLDTTPTAATAANPTSNARIEDAAWLAGRWVGTGLGGELEEVWSPPAGGQMVGHFRLLQASKPVFYEFMLLDVAEGGIRLRLKHFNPDHIAWEEKDNWTTFTPVSSSADELAFSALTIRRSGANTITMKLRLRNGDKVSEETLEFRRAPATP